MHSESLTLDVSKRNPLDPVILRVGEGGLTTIEATILNNDIPYDLTGMSVLFLAETPDLKVVYDACTVKSPKEGKVTYTVSKNLTHIQGNIDGKSGLAAYFRIQSKENQITTQNIPILILQNVDLDGEQAEEYTSQFEQLLLQVEDLISDVNTALVDTVRATNEADEAAAAANAAEDRIEQAEASRVSAENQRVSAENVRSSAEYSREQEEAQRITNEAQRVAAEALRASAEQARADSWETLSADAKQATDDATQAAQAANTAADRVDTSIDEATKATEAANKAAQDVEVATQDAWDAAGNANSAADATRAATSRLNSALEEYDTILSTEIAYAIGETSTTPPEEWTAAQQAVPQGMYAWERTITHHKNSPDTISYNVAYQGIDGKNGVGAQSASLFWLHVDEDGNLWADYAESDRPPVFRYDSDSGDLYAVV